MDKKTEGKEPVIDVKVEDSNNTSKSFLCSYKLL